MIWKGNDEKLIESIVENTFWVGRSSREKEFGEHPIVLKQMRFFDVFLHRANAHSYREWRPTKDEKRTTFIHEWFSVPAAFF